jgi:preprotein translocase subunit Sec63
MKKETKKLKVPKRAPRPGEGGQSKYKPEYCEEMLEYFNRGLYKETKTFNKKELNDLPTFQYYSAVIRSITHQTLLNWAAEHKEFGEVFNKCKKIQENILVQGGISRAYDPGFVKFILNSVSDTFKEKIEHTVDDQAKNLIKLAYNLPKSNDADG